MQKKHLPNKAITKMIINISYKLNELVMSCSMIIFWEFVLIAPHGTQSLFNNKKKQIFNKSVFVIINIVFFVSRAQQALKIKMSI